MSKAAKLKKKRVEDVLGGEEAWKNAARSPSAPPRARRVRWARLLCHRAARPNTLDTRRLPATLVGSNAYVQVWQRALASSCMGPDGRPWALTAALCAAAQRSAPSAATARRTTTRCRRARPTSRPRSSSAAASATITGRRAEGPPGALCSVGTHAPCPTGESPGGCCFLLTASAATVCHVCGGDRSDACSQSGVPWSGSWCCLLWDMQDTQEAVQLRLVLAWVLPEVRDVRRAPEHPGRDVHASRLLHGHCGSLSSLTTLSCNEIWQRIEVHRRSL